MKKLIKMEWAIGEGVLVSFQSRRETKGCSVVLVKEKKKIQLTPEEAREWMTLFEPTNYIFTSQ